MREKLLAYERKHGMSSAEFYERYYAGEFPEFPTPRTSCPGQGTT
jgi:hypothetical protein